MSRQPTAARVDRGFVAGALIVALGLVWAWWAWRRGAYFPDVFNPGAIALAAILGVLVVAAPWRAKLTGAPLVAVVLLAALGAWTLASALWTPAAEIAVSDAQKAFAYLGALLIGAWTCLLAGRRMRLCLLAPVLAGGLVGLGTVVVVLLSGEPGRYLDQDLTLDYPLGYRNANAAFLLIAFWAAITAAADRALGALSRGGAAGIAALTLSLAVLCQSRGAALACVVALVVWLAASPGRARAAATLGIVAAPVGVALPWLLDVFAEGGSPAEAGELLQAAVVAAAAAAVAGGLLVAGFARLERRIHPPAALVGKRARRMGALAAIAVGVAAIGVAATTIADPVEVVEERISQFGGGGTPDFGTERSRFSLDAGSDRRDFWRVALDEGRARPLLGGGAGSFQFAYLLERATDKSPRDPHSVELLLLSELGFVGLTLFAGVAIAVTVAALRVRRLGPTAAQLATAALAVGAYWFVQASVDWFWGYPGVTAPVMALLGAAIAPGLMRPEPGGRRIARLLGVAVAVLFAASLVPPFLASWWTERAYAGWRSDLDRAYADLDRAQALHPLAYEPLLAEGVIARESGDLARAEASFEEAIRLEPGNWAAYYFLGELRIGQDRRAAIGALERASELNPGDRSVARALARVRR